MPVRTLGDRSAECRRDGLPGIPRAELLGYLTEAAAALDRSADELPPRHRDITPRGLVLVAGRVELARAGRVCGLPDEVSAFVAGGITPAYAAPETFDGFVSRRSDQYSLAVTYQELLTGRRPFPGTRADFGTV